MNRYLLYVESNTTGTGMLALEKARTLGAEPVFLTHDPTRYRGLEQVNCRVLRCDTNSVEALRTAIAQEFHRSELAGIFTTSEFYLATVADLAAAFGLIGNAPGAMRACRNKAETRRTLAQAGVGQPRFAVVRTISEVAAALQAIGLPCIVKPADDTSSSDVLLCRSMHEAQAQVAKIIAKAVNIRGQKTAQTALIEAYLEAPEYSVEMFSANGHTHCVGITQKSLSGFPCFVEARHIFPADLPPAISERIEATVGQALQAVGITHGATHTEVKWTAQGCAIVEINARLAGGMIPEAIRYAQGIDLLEQQVGIFLGRSPALQPLHRKSAGVQFILSEAEGVLERVEGEEQARTLPGVQQVNITVRPGARVRPPRDAYDRLGSVIAVGESFGETAGRLQAAVDAIRVILKPNEGDARDD